MTFHKLLARQIKKTIGQNAEHSSSVVDLLERISKTYDGFDEDRLLIERSLDLSSKELIATNRSLEKEKERLYTTLNSIGDGAFTIDTNRRITFLNKTAQRYLANTSDDEVLGQPYDEVFHFFYRKDRNDTPLIIEKSLEDNVVTFLQKDTLLKFNQGSEIYVSCSFSPIQDFEGKVSGVIVVFKDVTREQVEDKMQSEFISLASHQLRTPITAIKWSLETVFSGRMGTLKDKQLDFLNNAYMSALHMTDLVDSLLKISRIETGKLSIAPEEVDLIDLCETLLIELQPQIQKKEHLLQFHKPDRLSKINTDHKLLKEIISNLLSNSIKYTLKKGVIDLKVSELGDHFLIEVADNGVGIPTVQQNRIFDKFFRAKNVVKLDTEGTGLGLYIIYKLVQAIKGEIRFESEESKGTHFYLTLPKQDVLTHTRGKGLV